MVTTIPSTTANTDYNYTSVSNLSEGSHTISVLGVYNESGVDEETIKTNAPVEIINFNTGAANVNLPTIASTDVYIGTNGKFVVDNVSSKFTYNVLNNSGHPYVNNTIYQTYLRTPIIVGGASKMIMSHMALTENDYDFAIVEASKDLVNWSPIGTYDEGSYAEWTGVASANVNESLFKSSPLNFTTAFNAGDEVAVRLRLATDEAVAAYGWIIKSIIPDSTLSVADVENRDRVLLVPNPAKESTSLLMPNNKGKVDIYIYDAAGKQVSEFKNSSGYKVDLNVSNLPRGLYLVLVKGSTFNKALKLVKQ